MDEEYTAATLRMLGFRHFAMWTETHGRLRYELSNDTPELVAMLDVSNALYAFCQGERVLYIGKTARSMRRRLYGYCNPGQTQQTNAHCNRRIREGMSDGLETTILVFTPPNLLQYGGFEINLAAGLEDILIAKFCPHWNGGEQGQQPVTETSELEADQEVPLTMGQSNRPQELGRFNVLLGDTYYRMGFVNSGVEASKLLGGHQELITVRFSDGTPAISSSINRTANPNKSVRLVGSNQAIAAWFQQHFKLGDKVTARILGPNEIELLAP